MLQCCKLHREEDEEQRREEAVGAVELLVVEHSQHELEEREERVGYGGVAGDVKPKRHVEGPEGGSERGVRARQGQRGRAARRQQGRSEVEGHMAKPVTVSRRTAERKPRSTRAMESVANRKCICRG